MDSVDNTKNDEDFVLVDCSDCYELSPVDKLAARLDALRATDHEERTTIVSSIPAVVPRTDSTWRLKHDGPYLKLQWNTADELSYLPQNQVAQFRFRQGQSWYGKKYNFSATVTNWFVDGEMCFFQTEPILHQGRMTIFKIHVLGRNCDLELTDIKSVLDTDIDFQSGKIIKGMRTNSNAGANLTAMSMRHLAGTFVKTLINSRR
jgi:hypothetical protein